MPAAPKRPARTLARVVVALALSAPALTACASAVQRQPVPTNPLETLIALQSYPVYWLGGSFHGLALTEVDRDRSGAVRLQYGECVRGGQYTCVAPLTVVTSPDNSFVPHSQRATRVYPLRSVRAYSSARGLAVAVPTGPVVVSVYAGRAALARAAARGLAMLNGEALPGGPLPRPAATSAFASAPLPGQAEADKRHTR